MKSQRLEQIETRARGLSRPSARLDCRTEDVGIHARVAPELEFVDVEMQVVFADLVECANDPAFHNGPESFDGISMNGSADVLTISMMRHAVWILGSSLR
jgi:hypothetical protein